MERRLAAILAADVAGYSRLIRADEEGTLTALKVLHADIIDPKINEHNGRIVKLMGDGMLAEFPSVVDAVRATVELQQALSEYNTNLPEDKKIEFRVGINLGDVVIDGDDIHGDGVNIAARLEGLATPGGICISGGVYDQVRDRIEITFEDLGDQEVKNIERSVRAWRWPVSAAEKPVAVFGSEPLPLPDKPSIAVLPFENMSNDPDQEFFADGIAEDLITTLSNIPRLFVIARNSTFVYKGKAVDVKQVAAEQGVRYVLEGSVRKAGNRVRINAQLIDALDGLQHWADRYDGELNDVFTLQDQITQEIVGALEVRLTDGEQARLWRQRAGDPRAYEHYLKGRALYNQFTRRANLQAREVLEEACRISPEFAMAYLFMGYTFADEARWDWGTDPERALAHALHFGRKALELDPNLPDGWTEMGYIHLLRHEHDEAVALAEKALPLGPSNADIHRVAAIIFNYAGLAEQGMSVAKQAVRLSPMADSNYMTELGHSHYLMGQYDEAITMLRRVLAATPFWRAARALLVAVLHELGCVENARAEAVEILRAAPRFSLARWAGCHPYQRSEDLDRYIGALRNSGLPE